MEAIERELDRLTSKANLSKSIKDIDRCLELLQQARSQVANDAASAPDTLSQLETSLKSGLEKSKDSLQEVYSGINKYGKALDKKFKSTNVTLSDYDVLSSHSPLIDRAIAMHLVREGQFDIADEFIAEANISTLPETLESDFRTMYAIKEAMRQKDLWPAIQWAAEKREQLEARGSNLEFELHRLMFVHLFNSGPDGAARALAYGRKEFVPFQQKYLAEITKLAGALVFVQKIPTSPYADVFNSVSTWESVSESFTSEFCALLKLSAESPLYVATTAGAIALPTLLKMTSIMKEKKTEWTSQNELPVEIPLPNKYKFHSIFVCPVSKEQTTEENPPMMIPCGHVLAKESIAKLSRNGQRFKCPYCPVDSFPKDAKEIFL